MKHDLDVLYALLRNDLASYVMKVFGTVDGSQPYLHNWHIDVIADHLEKVQRGEITRLIINLPPRNLKSIAASVAFSTWLLGKDPAARLVCASYSGELSKSLSRDCLKVMLSPWYRRTFPKTHLDPKKTSVDEFATTANGYRLATSVEGTLTGRGGNTLIIDDPIKPNEALSPTRRKTLEKWYQGTLYSRLDDKVNGAIIIIMQRVHEDDLVSYVMEKEDWVHLNLPAIADEDERFELSDGRILTRKKGEVLHPEREPLGILDKLRETLGSYYFEAQYLQHPIPEKGNIINIDWFNTYEELPSSASTSDKIVQSWDTAMAENDDNDYSVCTTWATRGDIYYLIDVYRERLNFPNLKKKVIEQAQRFKASVVLIEDIGSGKSLIQQLKSERKLQPIAFKPEGSKVERMFAQSANIEAGYVYLPSKASWLDSFKSELRAFPNGKHDDQVDSLSQFLTWIKERQPFFYIGD